MKDSSIKYSELFDKLIGNVSKMKLNEDCNVKIEINLDAKLDETGVE